MKYDPQKHHRRSIRLKGYDYTQPGAYFVTFCTYQRDEILGEVFHGEMKLSALGKIVQEEWFRTAQIRDEIQLFDDEFIVMPNHGHGIIRIIETAGADGVRPGYGIRPVKRTHAVKTRTHAPFRGCCATVRSYAGCRVLWGRSWQDLRHRSHRVRNGN